MPPRWLPADVASLLTGFESVGTHDLACGPHLRDLRALAAPISDDYAVWLEAFACIVATMWGPAIAALDTAPRSNPSELFHAALLMHLEVMTTTPRMAATLRYERDIPTSELHSGLERLAIAAPDQRARLTALAAGIEARLGTPLDQELPPQVRADLDALVTWARSQRGTAAVDPRLHAALETLPCLRADKLAIPVAASPGAVPVFDRSEMGLVVVEIRVDQPAPVLHALYEYWARREGWAIAENVVDATSCRLALRDGRNELGLAVARGKLVVRLRLFGYGHVTFS